MTVRSILSRFDLPHDNNYIYRYIYIYMYILVYAPIQKRERPEGLIVQTSWPCIQHLGHSGLARPIDSFQHEKEGGKLSCALGGWFRNSILPAAGFNQYFHFWKGCCESCFYLHGWQKETAQIFSLKERGRPHPQTNKQGKRGVERKKKRKTSASFCLREEGIKGERESMKLGRALDLALALALLRTQFLFEKLREK